LYFAVMLSVPAGRVIVSEAVAPAGEPAPAKVSLPAVPVTATGLPSGVVPEKNVTVPFGALPLPLEVATAAFSVTDVVELIVVPLAGEETTVEVEAGVIVTDKEKLGVDVPELPAV
jgi:hypothetical protein